MADASAVLNWAVTSFALVALKVTVNVNVLVPLFPSVADASAILSDGNGVGGGGGSEPPPPPPQAVNASTTTMNPGISFRSVTGERPLKHVL